MGNVVGDALLEFIVIRMIGVDLLALFIEIEGISVAPSLNRKSAGITGKSDALSQLTSPPIISEILPLPYIGKGETMLQEITCEIENETVQIQLGDDRHLFTREEADEFYALLADSFFENNDDCFCNGSEYRDKRRQIA